MATNPPATKTTASNGARRRQPRLRTNVVIGETADGKQHCVYVGPSADEALAAYAQLRADGGVWERVTPRDTVFTRALCSIDPRTSKHCSFAV